MENSPHPFEGISKNVLSIQFYFASYSDIAWNWRNDNNILIISLHKTLLAIISPFFFKFSSVFSGSYQLNQVFLTKRKNISLNYYFIRFRSIWFAHIVKINTLDKMQVRKSFSFISGDILRDESLLETRIGRWEHKSQVSRNNFEQCQWEWEKKVPNVIILP